MPVQMRYLRKTIFKYICCSRRHNADDALKYVFPHFASPDFWGLLNPEWTMCTKGRRQSPVDLDPDQILFDPFLRPLNVSKPQDERDVTEIFLVKLVLCAEIKCRV
ncbi:hypothetical protein CEXT_589091 [Caerostris extrusa]|uniref:Alpha-carbonic anhydrase domain-containing protein n=1 Tax=Caerostris extrusa TaxID=172846 RepID=A0AAV4UJC4_CAEEX|nr:hypothetical protein CEXT_589091 [Caerostris extrusa]